MEDLLFKGRNNETPREKGKGNRGDSSNTATPTPKSTKDKKEGTSLGSGSRHINFGGTAVSEPPSARYGSTTPTTPTTVTMPPNTGRVHQKSQRRSVSSNSNAPSFVPQIGHPHPRQNTNAPVPPPYDYLKELSAYTQTTIMNIQMGLSRESGIPREAQDALIQRLRELSRGINDRYRPAQAEFDRLVNQFGFYKNELAVLTEEKRVLGVALEHQQLEVARLRAEISEKDETIKFQDDQLSGKRNIMMETASARKRKEQELLKNKNPYDTPTKDFSQSSDLDQYSALGQSTPFPKSASEELSLNEALGNLKGMSTLFTKSEYNSLPYGEAKPGYVPSYNPTMMPHPGSTAEGSPGYRRPRKTASSSARPNTKFSESMALVLRSESTMNVTERAKMYDGLFQKLFQTTEGWAHTYCSEPSMTNDHRIMENYPTTWKYMMNLVYPDDHANAKDHVMFLCGNKDFRPFFVMRMGISYMFEKILVPAAFFPFNSNFEKELRKIDAKLQNRNLLVQERQLLIDDQSYFIEKIVSSKDYQSYRKSAVEHHARQLRDMLGLMLDDSADRSSAGQDLGVIVYNAWDLSVKMWSAHVQFQIVFPEAYKRFDQPTMIARDKRPEEQMRCYQIAHRVKLVMTPNITLRDDRGFSIVTKAIAKANVLLMPQ